jgi:DNA-binding LacI/PurR family transcriptional regulator
MASAQVDQSPRARAIRQIRQWLASGQPPAGERLPTEQAMADRLRVSRGTVRAALQALEREGLVRGRTVLGQAAAPAASTLMASTTVLLSAHAQAADRYRGSGYTAAVEIGAMDGLHAAGRTVLALPPAGFDAATVDELIRQRPRGVVVPMRASAEAGVPEHLERLRAAGIPAVVNSDEPRFAAFDRVEHDHRAGARLLADWLIGRGRRRPAFFCMQDRRLQWVQERLAGSDAASRDAGLAPQPPIWVTGRLDTAGLAAGERFAALTRHYAGFLAERMRGAEAPDALLVASDGECYATAAALRLLGLEPNRDTWLVGYDAYWRSCADEHGREPTHPLATIDKDNHRLGIELVRLLDARLAGDLPAQPQRTIMPAHLVLIMPAA